MTLRKIAKSMAKKTGESVEKIYKQLVNNKRIQRKLEADAFAEGTKKEVNYVKDKKVYSVSGGSQLDKW